MLLRPVINGLVAGCSIIVDDTRRFDLDWHWSTMLFVDECCRTAVVIIVVLSPWCDDHFRLLWLYRADGNINCSCPLTVACTQMVGLMIGAMQSCGTGLGCRLF